MALVAAGAVCSFHMAGRVLTPDQTQLAIDPASGQLQGLSSPYEVHASQGLKLGLYTHTILGGDSYLRSWFDDRGQ